MSGASRKTRVPDVLVILDGASEPLGAAPTSLERALTPALDGLCREGALERARTVAPWLAAGSESAIPALLGWVPPAPVERGLVEAAARRIAVPDGARAWRVDVRDADDGARAGAAVVRAAAVALAAVLPAHVVHQLGGHRLLVVGEQEPAWPAAAGSAAAGPAAAVTSAVALAAAVSPAVAPPLRLPAGVVLHPWPHGIAPLRSLDATTVVIAAPGAAAGIARLMGARVVTPVGATGRPGSDLAAKARAALDAIASGADRVVVHVGGPDEAAHELDAAAKVAAIEAADALLIAPLAGAVRAGGGTLRVCPDHGCDPATGRHDAAPVPCVTWAGVGAGDAQSAPRAAQAAPAFAQVAPRAAPAAPAFAQAAPRAAQAAPRRLTERAVAQLPVTDLAPRALAAA